MSTPEIPTAPGTNERLVSLDAYRGLVMLAMASAGLGFAQMASRESSPTIWDTLAHQTEHVAWRGCVFWDLIQPSFMFIVGVAMPFSFARRNEKGEPWGRQFGHVLVRSLVLIALGVFLSSAWSKQTNFTFVNVLTQIGLGYWFVFLVLRFRPAVQLGIAVAILVAYWGAFAAYPIPGDLDALRRVREVEPNWVSMPGFAAHWEKNVNLASDFDRWFLNLFPRPERFEGNEGGYATLNFIPSISTMIFGVLAGGWLRSPRSVRAKVVGLGLAGAVSFILASVLDPSGTAPIEEGANRILCPIVKRIWTPSWVLHSTAWTTWLLAVFYGVIDGLKLRGWAFPLVVVGMNSIAMYVMAQLMKPWIGRQLAIHLGTVTGWSPSADDPDRVPTLFAGTYAPVIQSAAVLLALWLICYWLYRRRIFLRI